MISSTTSNNKYSGEGIYIFLGPLQFIQYYSTIIMGNTASKSISYSLWLLVNLFQHEMLIAALFSCLCIPINLKYLLGYRLTTTVGNPNRILLYYSNFTIVNNIGTTSAGNNSRNIRSNKVLSLTQANNQRIILLGANQGIRIMLGHENDRIGTLNLLQNLANSILEITIISLFQQMRQHLSISFGLEYMALLNQLLLKHQIVLNNTIVYYRKIPSAVSMRMRIQIRWSTMSRPTGVTNTNAAYRHIAINLLLQLCQTAYAFLHTNLVSFIIVYSNTSRVITSILQLVQTFQQKLCCLLVTYITNNTTHNIPPYLPVSQHWHRIESPFNIYYNNLSGSPVYPRHLLCTISYLWL